MEKIKEFVQVLVAENKEADQAATQHLHQKPDKEVIGKCPKCGGNVYENEKSFYCENYKSNPPCKFSLWKNNRFFEVRGKKITKTLAKELMKNGRAKITGLTAKSGKKYDALFIMSTKGEQVNFEMEFINTKKWADAINEISEKAKAFHESRLRK